MSTLFNKQKVAVSRSVFVSDCTSESAVECYYLIFEYCEE